MTWSKQSPAVVAVLKFIKKKGGRVTPEQLVEWDSAHGKLLFDWNDESAAEQYRLAQARKFLNHFAFVVNGLRVRAFYNVPANEEAGIRERQYVSADEILDNPKLRELVIDDLTRRLSKMASELELWQLSPSEIAKVLEAVRVAMGG